MTAARASATVVEFRGMAAQAPRPADSPSPPVRSLDRWEALIRGDRRGLWAGCCRGLLTAVSWGYALGRRLHRGLYECGFKRRQSLPVPVLSVGNLTVGGVGKTPFVAWLSRRLREASHRPLVLARGYGRRPGEKLNEEGQWLLRQVPDLVVVQDPNRGEAARQALKQTSCDVVVLDDGFQHEPLERDLDVVLVDATRPFGYGALLPRGLLRESPRALARAHAVLITRTELATEPNLAQLEGDIDSLAPRAVQGRIRFTIVAVHRLGQREDPSILKGQRVAVMSGVGHPASVRQSVEAVGAEVRREFRFPDHHLYEEGEIRAIAEECRAGSLWCVTTAKDLPKLESLGGLLAELPLVTLEQGLEFEKGEESFLALVQARCRSGRDRRQAGDRGRAAK